MRSAQIKDSVVINFAEIDAFNSEFIDPKDAQIGAVWNGAQFFNPLPPAPSVPQTVTMRQAQLALLQSGYLDVVNNAISAASRAAQVEWNTAAVVERNSGLVPAMAARLGLTPAKIDALFILAATK